MCWECFPQAQSHSFSWLGAHSETSGYQWLQEPDNCIPHTRTYSSGVFLWCATFLFRQNDFTTGKHIQTGIKLVSKHNKKWWHGQATTVCAQAACTPVASLCCHIFTAAVTSMKYIKINTGSLQVWQICLEQIFIVCVDIPSSKAKKSGTNVYKDALFLLFLLFCILAK